jgi:hypothetical protein
MYYLEVNDFPAKPASSSQAPGRQKKRWNFIPACGALYGESWAKPR